MQDALLKTSTIDDHERKSIADTIGRLSGLCRLLPFQHGLFAEGFDLERRLGLTSVDALAIATIMDDAARRSHERAFLSLDKKSMTPVVPELKSLGVDVCHKAADLEAWLNARGVTL